MQAKIHKNGDITVVQLEGRIDFETTEPFRETCQDLLLNNKVVFNLSELSFVGSSGIGAFVSFMVTSETEGIAKPNAGIFENALKLGGAKAGESLYIGDIWETDVVGATNARIPTLWFNRERSERPEIPLKSPNLLLDEIGSLAEAIPHIQNFALNLTVKKL